MPDKKTLKKDLIDSIKLLLSNRWTLADFTKERVLTDLRRINKERELINLEAEVALDVCNERDEAGKPVYPNEATRKAEITNRLAKNKTFTKGIEFVSSKRKHVARSKAKEGLMSALVKTLESVERLYFVDLESKE